MPTYDVKLSERTEWSVIPGSMEGVQGSGCDQGQDQTLGRKSGQLLSGEVERQLHDVEVHEEVVTY